MKYFSSCYRSKVRHFYSKGAFLVLFWTTLFSSTVWMYVRMYKVLFRGIQDTGIYYILSPFPFIPLFVSAPLVGWLADVKLGNYGVFKIGSILLFFTSVLGCVCMLVFENVDDHNRLAYIISGDVTPVAIYSLGTIGGISCLVTALQLGLDQMPDASAVNISSFIAWFVWSISFGFWLAEMFFFMPYVCFRQADSMTQSLHVEILSDDNGSIAQVVVLLPVFCTSIVCSSLFIFAPKWMIIEPKSPQSLKTIYQVLKFAAKHKAPLNRSALTYWEDNIPSRMDLGKSKYGGPFTTEQVEDVKTVFKILVVLLPLLIVLIALYSSMFLIMLPLTLTVSDCTSGLLYSLTYSQWWNVFIANIVYEFGVYPVIRKILPSSLKRIGTIASLVLILNSVYLIFNVIEHFHPEARFSQSSWPYIVYGMLNGIGTLFLLTGVLEFVCAQAPYNMRGLLTGYTNLVILISLSFGSFIFFVFETECRMLSCAIIQGSISMVLSLVGFILYCVLAHWYKMRVRDEDYSPHRVIEEVYDRYLSQVR